MEIAAETYMSIRMQMVPCVPPASGRVPKGQEGRTMVSMESDWIFFMRNVMVLESSVRYLF